MRLFIGIAIGLCLMSGGQLCAQRAEPSDAGTDPFAPNRNAASPTDPAKPNSDVNRQVEEAALALLARSRPVYVGADLESYARIYSALDHEVHFDYLDQPLKDVIEDISFNHKIPIVIDTKALEDFAIDTATPITRQLKGVTLRSALQLTLRQLELTYVIRDEVLQITTPEKAAANPSIHLYPVAELVPPDGDGQVLVELIKTVVAPKTWCAPDATGAIFYVEHLQTLFIRQTDEVFHEIEELLATTKQLARQQRPQIRPGADPFGQ